MRFADLQWKETKKTAGEDLTFPVAEVGHQRAASTGVGSSNSSFTFPSISEDRQTPEGQQQQFTSELFIHGKKYIPNKEKFFFFRFFENFLFH